MKHCQKCGAQIADEDRFCAVCGAEYSEEIQPQNHLQAEKTVKSPLKPQDSNTSPETNISKKPSFAKKILKIIFGVIAVALIVTTNAVLTVATIGIVYDDDINYIVSCLSDNAGNSSNTTNAGSGYTSNLNNGCTHSWDSANCTEPAQCYNCGVYRDDVYGNHKWIEATCTKHRHCFWCDLEDGEPLGHNWVEKSDNKYVCLNCGEER